LIEFNYAYFKNKLDLHYGRNQQDIDEITSKESIILKINQCRNINELEVTIRDIIDDLSQELILNQNCQAKINQLKEGINNLSSEFKGQLSCFPQTKLADVSSVEQTLIN